MIQFLLLFDLDTLHIGAKAGVAVQCEDEMCIRDSPMAQVLDTLLDVCPAATYTIENQDCAPSLTWLAEQGYLEERA